MSGTKPPERHVLITGGAGYIGSLLTGELLREGYRVTVLDSLLFGGESLLGYLAHPNFHFVKADVTESRAVRDSLPRDWQKPQAVVHLAAIVGFPACQAVGKQAAWRYNVEATKQVYEQAAGWGAERFVFASTYSNYGLSENGQPVSEESHSESPVAVCRDEGGSGRISGKADVFCAGGFQAGDAVWHLAAHAL